MVNNLGGNQMVDNYPKAYREVHEILKHVPEEDLAKIPQDLIKTIEHNMDKDYSYEIEETSQFEDQNILRETRALLAVLYRDYWADENERKTIIQRQKYDIQKAEEKKKKTYGSKDLFANIKQIKEESVQINGLIIHNEPWYIKFINFMRKAFRKKNL